ncbi:MAG: hypothetical protein V7704_08255 [Aurantimonas endophytica]|uniref:hypothetical protein n=1 Tax=Aurantimonas endophytica TaxID=1522175 RepID=UPI003001F445
MSRELGIARKTPVEEFRYSSKEWAALGPMMPADKANRVRRYLEETVAPQYLISVYTDPRSEREETKRKSFERVAKAARNLQVELATFEVAIADYAKGQPPSFNDLVDEPDEKEEAAAKQWCDEFNRHLSILAFFDQFAQKSPPATNALKSRRRVLIRRLLSLWKGNLGRDLPKGGGRADGPTARFVFAAGNPILHLAGEPLAEIVKGLSKSALQEEIKNAQRWSKVEKQNLLL